MSAEPSCWQKAFSCQPLRRHRLHRSTPKVKALVMLSLMVSRMVEGPREDQGERRGVRGEVDDEGVGELEIAEILMGLSMEAAQGQNQELSKGSEGI